MTLSERRIFSMVHTIGRRWRRFQWTRSFAAALVLLPAWLLLMMLADNFLILPPAGLLAGWGLLAAAVLLGTVALLYRVTWGRPRAGRLALLYESRVPGQGNRLINAVQFLLSRQAQRDPMARAVVIENAALLDPKTARRAVDFAPVGKTFRGVALCAVLLGGYWACYPQWAANALQRLLQPTEPAGHLLAAEIQVVPGKAHVVEGDDLPVRAAVSARLPQYMPQAAQLEFRYPQAGPRGLEWKSAAMRASVGGTEFEYVLKNIARPLEYRVRAGRSVSERYEVAVQPRPRVEGLQANIAPPSYTGWPAQQLPLNAGNVAALVGSRVEIHLTATAELSAGHLELSDHSREPLELDAANPRKATAHFILREGGSYSVHLVDRDKLANAVPPQYSLTAQPDECPTANITAPARDLVLPLDQNVDVAIEAEDDIGLARIVLQIRVGNDDWKDLQQWTVPGRDVRRRTVSARLSPTELKLKLGDVLLYRAVAGDYREPEANLGVGRTWSLTVAAPAKGENLFLAQAKRLYESLEQILALQRQNRNEFDLDAALLSVRERQEEIRQLTLKLVDQQRDSPGGINGVLAPLTELANGLMLQATQLLDGHRLESGDAASATDKPVLS